jgi:hypothetical protein
VSHRKAERRVGKRWALIALASALSGCALAQTAVAAVPTPESATLCGGTLKRAKPTADDPNLVNYKFNCNGGITAYTLIMLRKSNDFNTVDDYASSVSVFDPTGNPLSTASFSCSGQIPGDGINCNAGAGGSMPSPDWAEGSFDATEPYCPNIPAGSPAGTKPDPAAVVELVVSDSTGAEDGPFRLRLAGKCPDVSGKSKTKSAKKTATKHVAKKASHR